MSSPKKAPVPLSTRPARSSPKPLSTPPVNPEGGNRRALNAGAPSFQPANEGGESTEGQENDKRERGGTPTPENPPNPQTGPAPALASLLPVPPPGAPESSASEHRLFIRCSYEVNEPDLVAMFSNFCPTDVRVVRESGNHRGIAFVTFSNQEQADAAEKACHGMKYKGSLIFLEPAKPALQGRDGPMPQVDEIESPPGSRLFVSAPKEWDEASLYEAFKDYGAIQYVDLIPKNCTRCIAFVKYRSKEAADTALRLHAEGHPPFRDLRVNPANPRRGKAHISSSGPPPSSSRGGGSGYHQNGRGNNGHSHHNHHHHNNNHNHQHHQHHQQQQQALLQNAGLPAYLPPFPTGPLAPPLPNPYSLSLLLAMQNPAAASSILPLAQQQQAQQTLQPTLGQMQPNLNPQNIQNQNQQNQQ